VEVFDREESAFDPEKDPIVRVHARLLRTELSRYYEVEHRDAEIQIELPEGSYVPRFRRCGSQVLERLIATTLARRNTLIVLPFTDHSRDAKLKYFCTGITDEIIHALTQLGQVPVLAAPNWPDVGSTLAAKLIVGGVRESAGEIRITVQCIDAASRTY